MTAGGPPSAPLIGHVRAFRADRLGFVTRLAREHGDVAVFRIGPYRVWQLADPADIHDVLVGSAPRFRKGPVLRRARAVLGDGLLTVEGLAHRRHRRLVQRGFSTRRVERYAAVMVDRVAGTADRWTPGEPVDLHAEAVRTTMTVAGSTLLGVDVEGEVNVIEGAIDDLLSAYKLAFVPFGWRLQHLPVGPMRRLQRGRATLHALVEKMIAERRAAGGETDDLLSALMFDDDGDALSDAEIRDEALTLLLAGHETTANALTFAFHLLAGDPSVEEQVHAEVDRALAGRLPTTGDLERLPTCRGLWAEALRLYPPSWAMGRQVVEDHPVQGYVIPADDLVLLPQWVVHRDPRWWPQPLRCDPGRWGEDTSRQGPRTAFFPFGGGIRRCIGEGFAETEGVLAVAAMASRWRLRPVAQRPLRLEPLLTLRPGKGLWMRPLPRGVETVHR